MNKKYLVDVTDLSPSSFDPKNLFNGNVKDLSNSNHPPFSSPFSPPPQKESFPWGLLLLAALIAPIFSPDLRDRINFDYSPTIGREQLLPDIKR